MKVICPVDLEGRLMSTDVPADTTALYNSATTYTTGNEVRIEETHTIYKCLKDTYTPEGGSAVPIKGLYPPDYLYTTNSTYPWMILRSDNKYACLDDYINTQTTKSGSMTYTFNAGGCDTIGLLNVEATTVSFTLTDANGVVVASATQNLYEYVNTAEEVFFSSPVFKSTALWTFPRGIGGTLQFTVSNSFGTAKLGIVTMGQSFYVGATRDEVQLPITDYSDYTTDSIGRVKLTKGLFADTATLSLYLENTTFSQVRNKLTKLRATGCLWCLGNEDDVSLIEPALLCFGYYTDLKPTRKNALSDIELTIGGMV